VWELICHHTYDWHGLPIDRSPWHSDGAAFGVDPLPDQGVRFLGPQSRISITRKAPWFVLGGIRIEITARLTDHFGFLIEGADSFAMYLAQGMLIGHGFGRDVINTYSAPQPIPLGQWVRLTFEHDGFSRMRLFIDDGLAATSGVINGIPGVEPAGVAIGNATDTSTGFLRGDINSVKIWRPDPRAMWHDFAQRPIDEKIADCWHDVLLRFTEILREHPECERMLRAGLAAALERLMRAVAAHGQAAWMQYAKFSEEHFRLWREGNIDGPEMGELAAAWIAWLRSLGIDPANDPELKGLLQSDCFKLMIETIPGLDCDPRFTGMLRLFAQASGQSRPATAS
jgi:hypothetical protein